MGFFDRVFTRRPAPLIGLDMSGSSLKLVELGQGAAGRYVLERMASQPLDRGWIVEGQVERFEDVAAALRQLVARSGTRTRRVALAMPTSAVITKKVALPAGMRDEEMELMVEAEANQYIPFPMDEVRLDHCVVGPSSASPDEVEVLIAAARSDRVLDLQGLAEEAGLEPVVLDVESHASRLALQHWLASLPDQAGSAMVALFEIGSEHTDLKVMRGGELLYEREQPFGGAQLTELIADRYGMTFEQAEQAKLRGGLPADFDAQVRAPFVADVAQEIGRALQFFFTSTRFHTVDRVVLSGGTARLGGLCEQVAEVTGVDADVVNPFEPMQLGPGVDASRAAQAAPGYLVACGLAMRRFLG